MYRISISIPESPFNMGNGKIQIVLVERVLLKRGWGKANCV